MADPLFLSMWLRGYSPLALPLYLRKALEAFPFSRLQPGAVLRVFPLSFHESPQLEELIDGAADGRETAARAQEFLHADCAFQVETRWDLYQWDGEWSLQPARVLIEVYGPEFDTDRGEHVRVDFTNEALFLPCQHSDQLKPVQSNIRSLLHLAQDLENELVVDHRMLWSESDEDFAARLLAML